MTTQVYLDNASSKSIDPRVLDFMIDHMRSKQGNASSIHVFGQDAKRILEESRLKIANLIRADPKDFIVFTSGATESNNLAIKGVTSRTKSRGTQIITSSIEHMSVINPCKFLMKQGFTTVFLPVDQYGMVDIDQLNETLTKKTILVSIMYANGEIGTIQPIKAISDVVHDYEAYLHVDATAACGQVPIAVDNEGIDLLTISSNDLYGPSGIGALYIRKGTPIEPLILGGGQEHGIRSGTENIAGIAGFGKAAEITQKEMAKDIKQLRRLQDFLITGLLTIPHSFLNGHQTKRLPDNVAIRFNYIEGEAMLLNLDMHGIAASSGSACTAKTLEPSHVLRAIGLKHEEAHGSVLFSLSKQNTEKEVTYVINVMPNIVKRLRAMSPLTPKELRKDV